MSMTGSAKLKISKPFGKTIAVSLLIMIAFAGIIEFGARTNFAQNNIPIQAYGTNHLQFEVQYAILEKYVEKNGAPECIIMGNSMAHRSMNPEVISQRIIKKTGTDLECFNFSIVGANIPVTAMMAKILINRFQPKLLIFGTSFIDYTERRETRVDERFLENPWLLYLLGEVSWDGWLLDNSYGFRFITFLSYLTNQSSRIGRLYEEVRIAKLRITPTGFAVFRTVFNIWDPVSKKIELPKNWEELLKGA